MVSIHAVDLIYYCIAKAHRLWLKLPNHSFVHVMHWTRLVDRIHKIPLNSIEETITLLHETDFHIICSEGCKADRTAANNLSCIDYYSIPQLIF